MKNVLKNIVALEESQRQTGRTTALAKAAQSLNGVLVVRTKEAALEVGKTGRRAISLSEFENIKPGSSPKAVYIFDNDAIYAIAKG